MNDPARASVSRAQPHQYVTFALGGGEYGIEIAHVQEFKGYCPVTPVPRMPPYLRGVINLRGVIMPVFDLRVRFGLTAALSDFTVIIVAVVRERTVGLIVDSVSDVIDIDPTTIQETPDFSTRLPTAFLRGMAKTNDRLVILLDLDHLIAADAETVLATS